MIRGIAIIVWAFISPFALAAHAQTLPPGDEPGRIEQRFTPQAVPRAGLAIRQGLESTVPPDKAEKIRLTLRAIHFEGNTALSSAELRDLYAAEIGKTISLRDVFQIAARVTARYGKAGYTLSRAIVPPQELNQKNATVTIRIIEGYVDNVVWPPEVSRYRDLFSDYSAEITAERPVRVQTIERYLLIANDLPGLHFSSRLRASDKNPAASTLEISLDREKHVSATLGVDNRGTDGSGPYQANANVVFSNVLGLHDEFTLGYATAGPQYNSLTRELDYINGGYHQVLSSEGLAFDISANASWGHPGTADLLLLQYKTDSLNLSSVVSYPFIRTRNTNLTGRAAFDWKDSDSYMLGALATQDKLRIIRGEFDFDHADEIGGVTQAIASVSQGFDGLGSTHDGNPLASRANGRVDFTKATLQLSRTQSFGQSNSAYVVGYGQIAASSLLSSQQCGYGGAFIGRAFGPSIVTGDDCALVLGELRHDFDTSQAGLSKLQLYAFGDYGSVWNINPALGTPAQDDGVSVGTGLRFGWKSLDADIQAAYQVKQPSSVSAGGRLGVFFDLTARF